MRSLHIANLAEAQSNHKLDKPAIKPIEALITLMHYRSDVVLKPSNKYIKVPNKYLCVYMYIYVGDHLPYKKSYVKRSSLEND